MLFADLGLSPDTLRALEDVGYEEPTPIQRMAIPHVMARRDVLGIAQTGTGKTASFTLPMIEILSSGRAKARMPRSLVLAPTRELASQVADNALLYSKYHKLSLALLIGGESLGDQQKILDKGVDILIATPGRLLDLFERGAILLRDVRLLVIDEADRMLDMGFIPDVERIVSLLPARRQTLFFSATMDKEIKRLADAFLTDPVEIRIEPTQKAAELVDQSLVVVPSNDKREALRNLLRREEVTNAFIFCNRKRDVDILNRSLSKHGFDAVALHGDMPQYLRTERLERFKNGEVALLVCSDVAARGIDISDVSHVFNFDVPIHSEDYVHRIGRTGRAGRKGSAFTIASPADRKLVVAIEELLGNPIPRVNLEGFAAPDLEGSGTEDEAPAKGGRNGKSRSRNSRSQGGRERAAPAASATAAPESSQPAARDERRSSEPAGGPGRSQGRHQKRWRDNPQSEVMEMPIDDNAIGFGGFTPAFILEPVVAPEIDEAEELLLAAAEDEDIVLSEDPKAAAGSDSASGRKASSRKKEPRRRSRSRKEDAAGKEALTGEAQDGTEAPAGADGAAANSADAASGDQPDAAPSVVAAEASNDRGTEVAAQDASQPAPASGEADTAAVSSAPASEGDSAPVSGAPEGDAPAAGDVSTEAAAADGTDAPAPKKAATRRKAPAKKAPATPRTKKAAAAKTDDTAAEPVATDAPATDAAATDAPSDEAPAEPVKKPATRTRRKAAPAEEGAGEAPPAKKPATRRASPRRKKAEEAEASEAPAPGADASAAGTPATDAAPSETPDSGA
ncbi:DEAD/DEAH box helicase [Phaeovibrio sulfidiphilus]|uniref:DEAD-box ATP-dependent RNA helicase RhpA n=1 Tax=Phaeovibrio sulfidiphilus TaxID=1220600 RepID=A0A8J7CDE3_9PROT|nr:DEAD/DEAH box helicase [Phaeovibrio sulfidiphilus]MBE1237668.1 DEAD/DEAH box helicase [Phaeovibrio sulfidiphilus]